MSVIVQKYGGSSVADIEKISNIAKTIIERKKTDPKIVVVVSAMGKTTDSLLKMAGEITDNPSKRELDALMSSGEIVSAAMLAITLESMGCSAKSFNAYQLNIKTSGSHGKSLIDDIDTTKINKALDEGNVVVVTGFQGVNLLGEVTTLGRGGSDTSAVALAVKLKGRCEIYTDVDGIYFTDPRLYRDARKLDEIEYEEMLELASLGAKVMHSRSIELAQKYGVEVYVGRSCSDIKGTYIRGGKNMKLEDKVITGLATSDDDIAITVKEFELGEVASLFNSIATENVSVDMISQTAPIDGKITLSFTIPKTDKHDCIEVVKKYVDEKAIVIDENITKFSLVGLGMKNTSGVAAKVFKIFDDNDIKVKLITTSEIRITCAINIKDKQTAINEICKEFNL